MTSSTAAGTYSVGNFTNKLIKIDVKNRNSKVWTEKGCQPGEPVFVPRPDRVQEEDDGVVLSVVLDSDKGNSFLLVLDAKSFEEIARSLRHHITFHLGFMGSIIEILNERSSRDYVGLTLQPPSCCRRSRIICSNCSLVISPFAYLSLTIDAASGLCWCWCEW